MIELIVDQAPNVRLSWQLKIADDVDGSADERTWRK